MMNYTPIPFDFLEEAEELTDEEYGRLIRWAQRYQQTGEAGELLGNERFLARRIRMQIDRYRENYEQKANVRRDAGRKGAAARWGYAIEPETAASDRVEEMPEASERIDEMAEIANASEAMRADGKNAKTETNTKTKTKTKVDVDDTLHHSTDVPPSAACAEQKISSAPAAGAEGVPRGGGIPLNDGSEFLPLRSEVEEWRQLYPAVDVMQQLRNMRGYFLANPKNRKTPGGIRRTINTWLSKEQNRAPRVSTPGGSIPAAEADAEEMRKYLGQLPKGSD